MKLWETYFRTWKRFGDSLAEETKRSRTDKSKETGESVRQEEQTKEYYGYLCDRDVCIESGV
jgi:hypothetical protein